jgi:hypothetical protein
VQIQIATHIGLRDAQLIERSQGGRSSRGPDDHFKFRHALAHEDRPTGSLTQSDGERQLNPPPKDPFAQVAEL